MKGFLRKFLCPIIIFLLFVFQPTKTFGQAPSFNANTQIIPYTGIFRYGVNSDFLGNNWSDTAVAAIAKKGGAGTLRVGLFDSDLEDYGYTVNVPNYIYYNKINLQDNVVFLNGAANDHTDNTIYNYPAGSSTSTALNSSLVFKNLYEPIWSLDSTVNPNNYFAEYVYQVVKNYGGSLKFYEVWNEPDIFQGEAGFLSPGQPGNWFEYPPAPQDMYNLYAPIYSYIRMLRIAYEVVHKYSPNSYVCTGGIGYPGFLDACLRYSDNPVDGSVNQYFPNNGGAFIDVVSFHDYPLYNLHKFDIALDKQVYSRHSDAAVGDLVSHYNSFLSVLSKYGYDGSKYPAKPIICTETNVASAKIVGDTTITGTPQYQKNYMMKAMVVSQKIGIKQLWMYDIANFQSNPNNATDPSAWMGMYNDVEYLQPGQEVLTTEGIGFKTISQLLTGYTYDSIATKKLNLVNDSTDGGAFTNGKNYRYVLWAKTHKDLNENVYYQYQVPDSLFKSNYHLYTWDASSKNLAFLTYSVPQISLTADPIIIEPTNDKPVAPVANAGQNHQTNLPKNSYLDGTGSSDPSSIITQYIWTKISGPNGDSILTSHSAQSVVTFKQTGTYIYKLKVIDKNGLMDTSAVQIEVYPIVYPIKAIVNGDSVLTLPQKDTLDGSKSTATTGAYLNSYIWIKVSGPPGDSIYSPKSAKTFVNFINEGEYIYRLIVGDNYHALDSTDYSVNVKYNPALKNAQSQFVVYPNPTTGLVSLYYDDNFSGTATVYVTDISGKIYFTEDTYKSRSLLIANLNLGFLKPGFYLFVVRILGKSHGFWFQKK